MVAMPSLIREVRGLDDRNRMSNALTFSQLLGRISSRILVPPSLRSRVRGYRWGHSIFAQTGQDDMIVVDKAVLNENQG